MKRLGSSVKGLDKLKRQLKAKADAYRKAVRGAIYEEAEDMMSDFKEATPVDRGHLRASGHVLPPEDTAKGVSVTMGFGGPAGTGNLGGTNPEDVGYAVHVHEDLQAHHPVGQAKYVEEPLERRKPKISENLARRIRQRLK